MAGMSPGFRRKVGQKPQGTAHFFNTIVDVSRNRGPIMKWGGTDILNGGGRTLLATTLECGQIHRCLFR